jgi:hypothetical protein
MALAQPNPSIQTRHGRTSCSSNLIGYPTVPKNLTRLVPCNTHSPNYMLLAFCLDCMNIEEGNDYSETSVTKYQQRRAISRKSEGLDITGIYELYSPVTWCNEKKNTFNNI